MFTVELKPVLSVYIRFDFPHSSQGLTIIFGIHPLTITFFSAPYLSL